MKHTTKFIHPGIFYLPVHPAGYVLTFITILFMAPVTMAVFNSPVNNRQQAKN